MMQPPKDPWARGERVQAQYNFVGNSSEDLPFKKRDVLTVEAPTKDPMWYYAENDSGRKGMIPANYVQKFVPISAHNWFHGKLPRELAEKMLIGQADGSFLVRESTNFPGDYTLCVSCKNKVEHYHILTVNGKFTIDEESFFRDMAALLEHYKRAVDGDGLCCQLKKAFPNPSASDTHPHATPPMVPPVDQQMFAKEGWAINGRDVSVMEVVGKGEFGDVHKGHYRGRPVAIKTLREGAAAQQFLQEAHVMTQLRHENLVSLIGVLFVDKTVQLVTEFMAKGSLVNWLRTRGRSHIQKKDQIGYAIDTCKAMTYLESRKVVHRDLAARNVLLAEDFTAKVSDFGLARKEMYNQDGGKFPIKWTSPEALRESKFTNKSDMWSFGILLWEIYTFGRQPYPRIPLAEVMAYVEQGYRMEAPEGCPQPIYDLMRAAWDKDVSKRPSFGDALSKLKTLQSLPV